MIQIYQIIGYDVVNVDKMMNVCDDEGKFIKDDVYFF